MCPIDIKSNKSLYFRCIFYRLESSFSKVELDQWRARQCLVNGTYDEQAHVESYDSKEVPIFVRDPFEGTTIMLNVKLSDTIESVKEKLNEKMGVAPDKLRIEHAGRQLEDKHTLFYYGIERDSSLRVLLRLCGC